MIQETIHQIAITGPGLDETYILPPGQTTIGRQDSNQLVLIHPLVSRRHAYLVVKDAECAIVDLGSTHGTLLNREPVEANTPHPLKSGDVVEIGAFRMVYERVMPGGPETTGETAVAPEPPEKPSPPPPDIPPPPAVRPPQPPVPAISQSWETARYVPIFARPSPEARKRRKEEEPFTLPAGLSYDYSSYMQYLPDIYRLGYNNFITRFLALLESILAPIEWTADNFDLFLDPQTAPAGFLPWLANWFALDFDASWDEEKQRRVLREAHQLFPRRGTAWALRRMLEIYTGTEVEIDDQNENLESFTFVVKISAAEQDAGRGGIERIINANKPAHTSYSLVFRK